MATPAEPSAVPEVRASELLKSKGIWVFPLVVGSVLVMLMTLLYFGSIVDPTAHMHGLPVVVVNQDSGVAAPSGRVDLGDEVVSALTGTPAVTDRLAVKVMSLFQAEAEMNRGAAYVTVDIPAKFTSSALGLVHGPHAGVAAKQLPTVKLLTNSRAGTLGVSLADGVLEPALSSVSKAIGEHLEAQSTPAERGSAILADPVSVPLVPYRPLASHAGLGLSAFYMALLIMMCGFLGATIVQTSVDSALGYATSEVGPWWAQKLPRKITRWQTLLAKWAVAVPCTLLLSGLLMAIAAGVLRMDAPGWFELWMFGWFAAAVVAIGTLVLFAALGALGQLVALLVFVYLALASSGGTIPLQALAGFYRVVANFEPLRQILGAVRSILYFNGAGDAGLDRGLVLTAIGLVFWVPIGSVVTILYDRKGFYRLRPEMLEYVHTSVRAYHDHGAGGTAVAAKAQSEEPGHGITHD